MPILHQLAAYVSCGAVGTAVQYVAFFSLISLGPTDLPTSTAVLASTLGAVLGGGTNYALNRRYTFRSALGHAKAAPRFAAVAAIGLGINASVVGITTVAGAHPIVAQLEATLAVLLCGFMLNRHWTFSRALR